MEKILFTLIIAFGLTGPLSAQKEYQKKFQTTFIEAEDGSVIELPAGRFKLDGSLWLDGKHNVTIKGAGIDKTVLSFKDQLSGAEGIKVTNASNITIRDLTVEDTKGDGIKTQLVEGIIFRNVKAAWTGKPSKDNGSYALYPVQCTSVLIDSCIAVGASDAGIYVGQSKHIIVRNSTAYHNVAGIEIENSLYADVHHNDVYDNAGGILVFDLPGLVQKEGGYVRVFNNHVHNNNLANFAPRGNIVGKVPQGTGVMVLATRNVEIFDNRITNNITASTAVVSYYITEIPISDKDYKPLPCNIAIHNNYYERPRVRATGKGRMGKMYRFKLRFGKNVPHIVYDGIEDEKLKERNICIHHNEHASFANLDAANGFRNISRDMSAYNCTLPPISPVMLTSR